MRKQLGIIASMLFMTATTLLWVGCTIGTYTDCSPACDKPCVPICCQPQGLANDGELLAANMPRRGYGNNNARMVGQPSCPQDCTPCCDPCGNTCGQVCPTPCCEPLCTQPKSCKHGNRTELNCRDGITVRAVNPRMCMLGDQYPLEFVIEACDDVCDVVVNAQLPEGVTYLKSTPEAKANGNVLTWDIGPMKKCECIHAKVWVKCECEGELCACFCATATPVRFCSLLCAKPRLVCTKCGPAQVCPGEQVCYKVTVTNRGSCAAEDVTLTDNIPEGLQHASGMRNLCYKLGTLAPCETRCVNIPLCAVKRGNVCNTAVVTACNADTVSCQACTCVCCCNVDLQKTGPKEVGLGKNADYQITVTNTGDLPLTNVVVTDCTPTATEIVSANGATVRGNQVVWKLRELKQGEKVTFNLTLTTCTPGCFTNRATVNNCEGCQACAETTTRWKGRPALHARICDTDDPICIGDPTSYCITVVNQGPEPDHNVRVTVRFPSQVQPVAVTGDTQGTISGNSVTFEAKETLWPRQTLNFRIDAKGRESGDGRVNLEVSSDSVSTPVVQQESTHVY